MERVWGVLAIAVIVVETVWCALAITVTVVGALWCALAIAVAVLMTVMFLAITVTVLETVWCVLAIAITVLETVRCSCYSRYCVGDSVICSCYSCYCVGDSMCSCYSRYCVGDSVMCSCHSHYCVGDGVMFGLWSLLYIYICANIYSCHCVTSLKITPFRGFLTKLLSWRYISVVLYYISCDCTKCNYPWKFKKNTDKNMKWKGNEGCVCYNDCYEW